MDQASPKFRTHTWLSPQVVPYFGKSPKLGLNQNLGHPLDSFASSPEFWYSPGPGAFALHFHGILENIRVSYIRVNLLRGGYRSLVDFFDTKSSTNLYTNQGSVKNYRGRPDNGYYNNSLSWSILICFAVTLKSHLVEEVHVIRLT
jgi:hypothetical protein